MNNSTWRRVKAEECVIFSCLYSCSQPVSLSKGFPPATGSHRQPPACLGSESKNWSASGLTSRRWVDFNKEISRLCAWCVFVLAISSTTFRYNLPWLTLSYSHRRGAGITRTGQNKKMRPPLTLRRRLGSETCSNAVYFDGVVVLSGFRDMLGFGSIIRCSVYRCIVLFFCNTTSVTV